MTKKLFIFDQNYSQGDCKTIPERGINKFVIIQAYNANDANLKAEEIGLYFDGVYNGIDKPTDGDRWFEVEDDNWLDIFGHNNNTWVTNDNYFHFMDNTFKQIDVESLMDNHRFTYLFDDNNEPIFVGDTLLSVHKYEVVVRYDEKFNEYEGQLVCDENHSCKNIPYALNNGMDYTKIN